MKKKNFRISKIRRRNMDRRDLLKSGIGVAVTAAATTSGVAAASQMSEAADMNNVKTNMGIGADNPVLDPKTVFRRNFRFLLFAEDHSLSEYCVSKATIDSYSNKIEMDLYELGETEDWIKRVQNTPQNFHLVLYDGCGEPIEGWKFYECYGTKHTTEFNYAASDILTHKVTLSYKRKEKNTGKTGTMLRNQKNPKK